MLYERFVFSTPEPISRLSPKVILVGLAWCQGSVFEVYTYRDCPFLLFDFPT